MRMLRGLAYALAWGLVLAAGWLKGGDDASTGIQLSLLFVGGVTLIALHGIAHR